MAEGVITGETGTGKELVARAIHHDVGLQAKLLRVLQEREIEPLGAERSETVDVVDKHATRMGRSAVGIGDGVPERVQRHHRAARIMGISPRALSYYLAKHPSITEGLALR